MTRLLDALTSQRLHDAMKPGHFRCPLCEAVHHHDDECPERPVFRRQ